MELSIIIYCCKTVYFNKTQTLVKCLGAEPIIPPRSYFQVEPLLCVASGVFTCVDSGLRNNTQRDCLVRDLCDSLVTDSKSFSIEPVPVSSIALIIIHHLGGLCCIKLYTDPMIRVNFSGCCLWLHISLCKDSRICVKKKVMTRTSSLQKGSQGRVRRSNSSKSISVM